MPGGVYSLRRHTCTISYYSHQIYFSNFCLFSLSILYVVCGDFYGTIEDRVGHSGWGIEEISTEVRISSENISSIRCFPNCAPWNTTSMRCNSY